MRSILDDPWVGLVCLVVLLVGMVIGFMATRLLYKRKMRKLVDALDDKSWATFESLWDDLDEYAASLDRALISATGVQSKLGEVIGNVEAAQQAIKDARIYDVRRLFHTIREGVAKMSATNADSILIRE